MPVAQPVTRNPERTRRRILDAAIQLFSKNGFRAVSIEQIVSVAKVNKRMVYHYFGNKDGLFEAGLSEVYLRLEDVEFLAVERGRSAGDKLARLLEGYFQFLHDEPEFSALLQWENLEKGRHLTKRNPLISKNPFFSRFRAIVEDGMKSGEFRGDINVTHLLIHLIGLCWIYRSNRHSLSQGLHIDLGNPKVVQEGLNEVLRLVFDGISNRSER